MDDLIRERRNDETWTEKEALKLVSQLIFGMKYVHEQKIIHRDLKPKNIFMRGDQLLIGDFDISGNLEKYKILKNKQVF